MTRGTMAVLLVFASGIGFEAHGAGVEVSGAVKVPEVCSPSVSPAVVYLEPADGAKIPNTDNGRPANDAELALVNQRGLQFTPRVQAIAIGQAVRFTNQDGETHNVHVVTPGFTFNESMTPGRFQDFTPEKPGVMVLACDVHIHMRGYVVVSPTPWFRVCSAKGRFRLDDVPAGRYVLHVWHEMAKPLTREIQVEEGHPVVLSDLALAAPEFKKAGSVAMAPVRPWNEVIDRIGMLLTASRQAAGRTGQLSTARRLAEDAYWVEFEGSDMEVAVRRHLGFARAGEVEQQFRRYRAEVREVAEKKRPASILEDRSHNLLLDLVGIAQELNKKGVTDGAHLVTDRGDGPTSDLPSRLAMADQGGEQADPSVLLRDLRRGFAGVREASDRVGSDEAASELTSVYMTQFEPIERYLLGRSPQSVRPLEITFNEIRGEIQGGLAGDALTARLDRLDGDVEKLVAELETRPAGVFSTAFFESLITIVREGVEVILVLAMLIAIVSKASVPGAEDVRTGALRAIWAGVGLAIVASLATAIGLNLLVSSTQGRAREILEGLVMMLAAGVLFYVSYWLVSQAQAKRWMDFLKRHARRGVEWGGGGTLLLTAFLAVYREGAETALMYQALIGSQGTTRAGMLGLGAGLLLGLLILVALAVAIRATSVRLPLGTFFKLSGAFLFALAVIFAGNGVFALQTAGILRTTPVSWLGSGLPIVGLFPNIQVVSVQGLLLAGALLSWVLIPSGAIAQPAAPRKDGASPIPA